MSNGFDLTTLVFLALAVFVIFKLRQVLGTRTGTERRPDDIRARREGGPGGLMGRDGPVRDGNNVIPLPGAANDGRNGEMRAGETRTAPDADRWRGIAEPGSAVARGLDEIARADRNFDAANFLAGAKAAYEMIVVAFAAGDRKALRDLLSKEVFDGFSAAIADRESRGETVQTTFVAFDRAEITGAEVRNRNAQVTVRFASKLITSTRDKDGNVIDGSVDKVVDVTDVWTFARDVSARDPNWKLVATESGA